MAKVFVSFGSNIDSRHHIQTGLEEMQQHYGPLTISSVYESPAFGFVGDNFYNLVVRFETTENAQSVVNTLRNFEYAHGRRRREKSFEARTLDLDLLLYENLIIPELSVPREDIVKYAFVLLPLAEIAPLEKHPVTGQTYVQLWENFAHRESQPLWKVVWNCDQK